MWKERGGQVAALEEVLRIWASSAWLPAPPSARRLGEVVVLADEVYP